MMEEGRENENERASTSFIGESSSNENKPKDVSDQHIPTFTHSEAMTTAQEMLSGLIMNDPMLRDLDQRVTLEEVNSMIALEYGQAMVVNIRRQDNEVIRGIFGRGTGCVMMGKS